MLLYWTMVGALIFAGSCFAFVGWQARALSVRAAAWRFPVAITDLRVGAHQVLLVRVTQEVNQEQLVHTLEYIRGLFSKNGINVPIIISAAGLEFYVVGDNVADAHQKVPA